MIDPVEVPDNTIDSSSMVSANKQLVTLLHQFSSVRSPEPYKGKGIRYENEHIIRKEGKTGK